MAHKIIWHIETEKNVADFMNDYFKSNVMINSISNSKSKGILREILISILPIKFTIIRETNHVDKGYTEGYYLYYSNKHITHIRFCERLSLFKGKIELENLINNNAYSDLQMNFVGCIVIQPLSEGFIGRTLLSADYLIDNGTCCYIRTAKYTVNIRGISLTINAFPYRMQDAELVTCAEVTLLNLLEYYGVRYNDYNLLQTEELVHILRKDSIQRVVPTHGLTYETMTKILTKAGFAPRLYSGQIYNNAQSNIKDILFYYIESGIPVGIGFFSRNEVYAEGHSMVCIGYSSIQECQNVYIELRGNNKKFVYYNASDFYNKFIMMDDNKVPYSIREIESEGNYINIMVPLPRRMFMEASDAFSIAKNIIIASELSIDKNSISEYQTLGDDDNPIVLRLFLTSSRNYKHEKMQLCDKFKYLKAILFDLPLPRFIWVCECFQINEYLKFGKMESKPLACGEIIIDSTANPLSPLESILLIHYPGHIAYRYPDDDWYSVFSNIKNVLIQNWEPFPCFEGNLHQFKGI